MQHARDRIRFMTMRARLAAPVEQVVQEVNLFLRGWAGYFRYGCVVGGEIHRTGCH
ncbi:MAG: group II intron maturase-specific domain-containing protein [Mycobacterium sp.]|uniref:group II intron maturase-specific domain-containing protein n=1 Tax=Mycobacterium sp. TaxID=1785 RepID=UPI003F9DB50F